LPLDRGHFNLSDSQTLIRKPDLRGAFGAPGTNVLAIKLSYWFAPCP
jgi:hypothetical protein